MINPDTHHHEGIQLLPLLGSAFTAAVLWVKLRADERKARKNNTTNQTPKDKHP